MDDITPEAVKAALDGKEPVCAKCGHPQSNHPYRHPFFSVGGSSLEDMAPALARDWLRLKEVEKAGEALADLIKGDLVGSEWKRECRARVAAFRAAVEGK